MKRESGENPEQTRCCKLHVQGVETRCHCPYGWEGLDNRSKSEDLPCIVDTDFRGIKSMQIKSVRVFRLPHYVVLFLAGTMMLPVAFAFPEAKRETTPLVALTDSIRVKALDEVTVNGQSAQQDASSAAVFQRLNEAELRSLNALMVADAVTHFSGTLIRDYGGLGGMKTINVRGMSAHHTAVAYDGITLTDCQTGQIDLSRYSLENINRMELSIGDGTDIFQPARTSASSSLLSLQTRKPEFQPGKRMNRKAGLKTGSFGLLNPDLRMEFSVSPLFSLSVSGEYLTSKGDYPYRLYGSDADTPYRTEKRHNNASEAGRGEVSLYGKLPHHVQIELKGYGYTSSKDLPGAVILYNTHSAQHLWDNTFFVQTHVEQTLPMWRWQLNAKYQSAFQRYINSDYLNSNGKEDQQYKQDEAYLSGVLLRELPAGFALSVATDAFLNRMSSNMHAFSNPLRLTLMGHVSAAYQSEFLSGAFNLLGAYVNEETLLQEPAKDRWKASPSFSLSWKPRDDLPVRVRTFYKSSFRMPGFNDLYYSAVGNRNLRPENSRQLNAGITLASLPLTNHVTIRMEVDGYYNRITDKIVAIPTKNIFVWSMVNLGEVHMNGVDVAAEVNGAMRKNLQWTVAWNHSYQRALDKTDAASPTYNNQIAYAPRIYGSGRAVVQMSEFEMAWSVVYSGHRYVTGHNLAENRLPGYTDQSVSLARRFNVNKALVSLKVEALNLAGAQYELVRNFPMPGRSFRCGIHVNF